MPKYIAQVTAGAALDGLTPATGRLVFGGTSATRDERRACILSIGVQSVDGISTPMTNLRVAMAPTLSDYLNGSLYVELFAKLAPDTAPGVNFYGCELCVPSGWDLYLLADDNGQQRTAFVDWRRVAFTTWK